MKRVRYGVRRLKRGNSWGSPYEQCGHKHYSLEVARRCKDKLNKESQDKTWHMVQYGS